MKKHILRAVFIVILVAIIGLYIFDIVVNNTPFTKNLFRTISIALVCCLGFNRVNYSARRRSLQFYESHFADAIRNAFAERKLNRNKLLCAVRLFDEGNYRKAMKYLTQLRQTCKTADDYYAIMLFVALCFTRSEMYAEATKIYQQMANNELADSRIYSNMGFAYSQTGETEKSMSCYKEALYLDKNNANTHVNIAHIYFSQHELDEAISWAEKALQIDPKLRQAATLLAIIYAITEQKNSAEKYRHIAIANGQDPDELKNAIDRYKNEQEEEN